MFKVFRVILGFRFKVFRVGLLFLGFRFRVLRVFGRVSRV